MPGYLLNQFSLSEYKGVLRAATTDTPQWWSGRAPEESQSLVTALDERAGALVPVGRVGGLGRGERIYAVRFIDDAGFVVTFRQTDPLYTIDLADPASPRVLGELEVNGYSAYLHPVAKDLLVGVGQDATDQGRRLGVQLSLFDVSDLRAPRRLFSTTLGKSSSTDVEYDHRAFLWWTPRSLAVFPLQVYDDGSRSDGTRPFTGAIGLRVGRRSGIHEAAVAPRHGTGAYDHARGDPAVARRRRTALHAVGRGAAGRQPRDAGRAGPRDLPAGAREPARREQRRGSGPGRARPGRGTLSEHATTAQR